MIRQLVTSETVKATSKLSTDKSLHRLRPANPWQGGLTMQSDCNALHDKRSITDHRRPTYRHAASPGSMSGLLAPDRALLHALRRLWVALGARRRRQFFILLLLMLCGSAADLVSIGIVFPFLIALTSPAVVLGHAQVGPMLQALGVQTHDALILALTMCVIAAVALSNLLRLAVSYLSIRYGYAIGTDLGVRVFRDALYQPYATHVARHGSVLISAITVKVSAVVHGVLMPMLVLINAAIILLLAAGWLLWTWPWLALTVIAAAAVSQGAIGAMSRRALRANSQRIADGSTQAVKALQEGLGGIRDVVLDGAQEAHAHRFEVFDRSTRRAQADNAAVSAVPRYLMEFVGVTALVSVAYWLARSQNDFATAVPTLGLLAMAAQRLLPYLQQAIGSWLTVGGNSAVLVDTLALLETQPAIRDRSPVVPLQFADRIQLIEAGFRYGPTLPLVLDGVNCTFEKGKRYGLIGSTGSGKSTFLDILMGLLEPTQGEMRVDGVVIDPSRVRSWQARLAHVPQAIFLTDASIEENIALGVPRAQIDRTLLFNAARRAQIHETIDAMPQGYSTFVGERGVRLSGGQRQRIGIARALYKRADVILLDEATSALDSQTEAAVAQAIHELGRDVTLFIVAHRLSTLRHCDEVLEFLDGRIHRRGSYASVVGGTAA
jgi:ATP-binding cassette, subfamily B, bacterial PglK